MRKNQSGVFGVIGGDRKARRAQKRELRNLARKAEILRREARPKADAEAGFPRRAYPSGGERRDRAGVGTVVMREPGVNVAGHTAATRSTCIYGAPLGPMLEVGGTLCVDPWECDRANLISGMSMLLFGTVGTGKSTLAKCWCARLVQFGKKLAVASDLKGEWTEVVQQLGGVVIQIGTGLPTRLNPLEEGVRPSVDSMGNQLTDEGWSQMVRTRRM